MAAAFPCKGLTTTIHFPDGTRAELEGHALLERGAEFAAPDGRTYTVERTLFVGMVAPTGLEGLHVYLRARKA